MIPVYVPLLLKGFFNYLRVHGSETLIESMDTSGRLSEFLESCSTPSCWASIQPRVLQTLRSTGRLGYFSAFS